MTALLRKNTIVLLTAFLLACGSGCTSIPKLALKWPGIKTVAHESATNPVLKVISIWQPGSGIDPEGKSCRGFSGQIMFYTAREQAISTIEGGVKIYIFDDQGKPEEQIKPIHIWEFKPEVWKALRVDSPMGPTYQVFIPYSRKGAHEANCSLRLKYMSPTGNSVSTEMVNVTLPGTKTKPGFQKLQIADASLDQEMQELEAEEEIFDDELPEPESEVPRPGKPPAAKAVPLDAAEQQRILREFQQREGGSSFPARQRLLNNEDHPLMSPAHSLDEEDEGAETIPPSERFGLKPGIRSVPDDWNSPEGETSNDEDPESGIRQASWESAEPAPQPGIKRTKPGAPARKSAANSATGNKNPTSRRDFNVYSIPIQ